MDTRTVGNRPRRVCRFCGAVHSPTPRSASGCSPSATTSCCWSDEPWRRRSAAGRCRVASGRGEDPRAAAARETLADANLVVDVGDLVDVYANPSAGDATVFLLYRADVVGGELRAGDDAADARFFGRTGLPGLAFASTVDAVRRWLATRPG